MKNPKTPFATRLSGSARETELRLRNIFQWKKKRPPVVLVVLTLLVLFSCFGLFACVPQEVPPADDPVAEEIPEIAPEVTKETDAAVSAPVSGEIDLNGGLSEPYVFMAENHVPTEYLVSEEWPPLTAGQKDLLTRLPAGELPKEAAWGSDVARKNIWEDTLVPLVYNAEYDVTLYGVVGAEELWGRTNLMNQELRSDGLVLRVGDQARYYPFSWSGDHWYGGEPTLELLDTDGDGRKDSAAVIPWSGRGVGVHTEVLYQIDLDDLGYQTVDFSQLNVQVQYDPTAKTATLTCGDSDVTVDTSAKEDVTRCTAMGQVHFRVEEGQILCSVGLDFGGAVCYWAWANGVIRFTDTGPFFTDIVLSDTAAVQNG